MSDSRWVDLANCDQKALTRQCDVCVVGAGAAGIYLAVELANRGLDVILLEAGNKACTDASAIGFDAQFDADLYPGATLGRFFGLGGSTSRWGGALAPHTEHDLRSATSIDAEAWQHIVQAVTDKTALVLNKLGWTWGRIFQRLPKINLRRRQRPWIPPGLKCLPGYFCHSGKKISFICYNIIQTSIDRCGLFLTL